MRIDNPSAPSGKFGARVSAAVTTADRRPGRGAILPADDTAFAFAVPSEGGMGSAEAPPATTAVAQLAPSPTSTSKGGDSAAITDPTAFALSPDDDPAPPAALPLSGRLVLILVSGPAGPFDHSQGVLTPRRESHGQDRLWPSLRPLLLPPPLPLRYPFRPAATAPSPWELLFQDFRPPLTFRLSQLPTWMPSALLLNYSRGFSRALFAR